MSSLPKRLDQVSVTELASFRECRRAWYWGSVMMLVPKTPDRNLWFGEIMHGSLQVFAATQDIEQAVAEFYRRYDETLPDIQQQFGGLWQYSEPMFKEYYELGPIMLRNYALFDQSQGMKMTTVSLEQRVWVPIRNARGTSTLKGSPRLTARMDRIVGVGNDLYAQDYKSGTTTWTHGKQLELDDQMTGYNYVYWRMTGELFRGVIYETLLKKAPEMPRILKNGVLSTAKDQNTLYGLYKREMQLRGLMGSAKHQECLEALKVQGWDGYYSREISSRNLEQMLAYQEHLYFTYKDMRSIVLDPRKAYPNPSPFNCQRCPFVTPCLAMEDGSDYQSILDTHFKVAPEKRW